MLLQENLRIRSFSTALAQALSQAQCDHSWDWHNQIGRVLLIGNGGSCAVAAHIANDIVARGGSALTLTDPATLTCAANDHGWHEALAIQVRALSNAYRILIAISSSGKSQNILNAVTVAKESCAKIVTFSGFSPNNPLRAQGDCNYYVPSSNYGIVEIAHLAILHAIVNPGQ